MIIMEMTGKVRRMKLRDKLANGETAHLLALPKLGWPAKRLFLTSQCLPKIFPY